MDVPTNLVATMPVQDEPAVGATLDRDGSAAGNPAGMGRACGR